MKNNKIFVLIFKVIGIGLFLYMLSYLLLFALSYGMIVTIFATLITSTLLIYYKPRISVVIASLTLVTIISFLFDKTIFVNEEKIFFPKFVSISNSGGFSDCSRPDGYYEVGKKGFYERCTGDLRFREDPLFALVW